MKTTTLILGGLTILAVCAAPLASANITLGACANSKTCASESIATADLSCYAYETPTNGSIIDQPSCKLNF